MKEKQGRKCVVCCGRKARKLNYGCKVSGSERKKSNKRDIFPKRLVRCCSFSHAPFGLSRFDLGGFFLIKQCVKQNENYSIYPCDSI